MGNDEVAVATFATQTEAEMWAGILRSEGIPSVLVPLGFGAGGLGPTVWRPFELRVRPADADRARRVLATLEHTAGEPPERRHLHVTRRRRRR